MIECQKSIKAETAEPNISEFLFLTIHKPNSIHYPQFIHQHPLVWSENWVGCSHILLFSYIVNHNIVFFAHIKTSLVVTFKYSYWWCYLLLLVCSISYVKRCNLSNCPLTSASLTHAQVTHLPYWKMPGKIIFTETESQQSIFSIVNMVDGNVRLVALRSVRKT